MGARHSSLVVAVRASFRPRRYASNAAGLRAPEFDFCHANSPSRVTFSASRDRGGDLGLQPQHVAQVAVVSL